MFFFVGRYGLWMFMLVSPLNEEPVKPEARGVWFPSSPSTGPSDSLGLRSSRRATTSGAGASDGRDGTAEAGLWSGRLLGL